jgi:hypothetical protein
LGKVHIVCNDTGISIGYASLPDVTPSQWDWILGVWGLGNNYRSKQGYHGE